MSGNLGGAIDEKTLRIVDVAEHEPRIHVDNVLRGLPMMSAPAPQLVRFVHGITDFIPRNIQGGDQFFWRYNARDEEELHTHLVKQTTGKGFDNDAPLVQKAISDSFEKYPKLQALYHR